MRTEQAPCTTRLAPGYTQIKYYRTSGETHTTGSACFVYFEGTRSLNEWRVSRGVARIESGEANSD